MPKGVPLKGGRKPGAGRPKGSIGKNSFAAREKLEELLFDPIEKMVGKYHEIQALLESGDVKKGSGAFAQLQNTQQQILNNLMAYGYRKVPEKVETEDLTKKPMSITLQFDNGDEVEVKKAEEEEKKE